MLTRDSVLAHMVVAVMLALAGCSHQTTLSTTWKDPNTAALSFKKVVVVVLNSSPGERRAQEDALVGEIKRAAAVQSYTLIPDEQLKDVAAAKQKIVAEGFDAAVILRLVDARQQTTVVPGNEATWDGQGYLSYKDTSGYVLTDTIVVVEVNLFSVPSGNLLWSGSSETLNPANARALAVEVARAAAAELRTQRLIQ